MRVLVSFGKTKKFSGLVTEIHENPPKDYQAKYVEEILDPEPIAGSIHFKFWTWLAEYYLCYPGEVMQAALPAGLKLTSESHFILHPGFDENETALSDEEYLVLEALRTKPELTPLEISAILDDKKVYAFLKGSLQKNFLQLKETVKEKFKPKTELRVSLNKSYSNQEALESVFKGLEKKAPKQTDTLLELLKQLGSDLSGSVHRERLNPEAHWTQIKALEKKGIVDIQERIISRFESVEPEGKPKELSEAQTRAFDQIKQEFQNREVVLLHGVTSSGKTEIYVRLIEEVLNKGRQVLYLIPEIAITAQLISRLRHYFGDAVGVYHSKFNENERVEIWNTVNKFQASEESRTRFSVILGARSSMFLPFRNLGLIIVDEEHDPSLKQHDPAPRYHARDAAIYLATLHGAKVLLGTATPSLETYRNCKEGKFGLVEIQERFGGISLPGITLSDPREGEEKKSGPPPVIGKKLGQEIESTLKSGEQVILFQNRRGFAPVLECRWCAWVPTCENCDVSLVYHKSSNQARCHYCGFSQTPPARCPSCNDNHITMLGTGTEKVAEELGFLFPETPIARMDLDTTRSKYGHYQIISDFSEGKTQILVGTQMVTKGLDFDRVGLVGIIDADGLLKHPDFRARERAMHLMWQVAGRAGRRNKIGKVVIQTRKADSDLFEYLIHNDYKTFFHREMEERQRFNFPPYCRLINLTSTGTHREELDFFCGFLKQSLDPLFPDQVLGPEYPAIARVRNKFRKVILIKCSRNENPGIIRSKISGVLERASDFQKREGLKSIRVIPDVDPM